MTQGRKRIQPVTCMTWLFFICMIFTGSSAENECSRAADVVFVLDASESIYDEDFIIQMDFVINITREFYLNETDGIVVGAVVYSSSIGDVIPLDDFKTQPELDASVRNFVHLKDGTNTALGIDRMRTLFSAGGREGVRKLGIVVTDGRSIDKDATLLQSQYAKVENVTMLAVGVGIEIDFQELQAIASGDNLLFQVQNYEELGTLALNLTTTICPEMSEPEEPQEGCQGTSDVFFVIDGSESIFDEDFRLQLDFVQDVTSELFLNDTDGFMVGALVFSSIVNSEIRMRHTQASFRRGLDQATRIKAGTATDAGIRRTREIIQADGRSEVRQVAAVITDGRSKNTTATAIEANLLKDAGVEIIALGIGPLIDVSELYAIASLPEYVFRIENFADLKDYVNNLTALLCPQADDIVSTTPLPTTTPEPTPTRPLSDPECDNCRIVNGVGYNPHPSRCDMYTQCYPLGEGNFRSMFRPCPPGLFWQQAALTCNRPTEVDCAQDLCINATTMGARHPDSCRAYWECSEGATVGASCCGEFQSYIPGTGCVEDFQCADDCILDHTIPPPTPCHLEEHDTERSKYYMYEWGLRREMTCAHGTEFSFQICACDFAADTDPDWCQPDLYLPFDDFLDHAQGNWIENQGAVISDVDGAVGGSAAYFDGSSRVIVPRFSSHDFRDNVFISLRYRREFPMQTGGEEALVTNADCDNSPSIAIYHDNLSQANGGIVRTAEEHNSTSAFELSDWNDVTYSYDGRFLLVTTNGRRQGTAVQGNIGIVPSALHIGDGAGFENFRGYIDELYVYLNCRP